MAVESSANEVPGEAAGLEIDCPENSSGEIPYFASRRAMTVLTWQSPWRSAWVRPRGVRIVFMFCSRIRGLVRGHSRCVGRVTSIIRIAADTLGHAHSEARKISDRVDRE